MKTPSTYFKEQGAPDALTTLLATLLLAVGVRPWVAGDISVGGIAVPAVSPWIGMLCLVVFVLLFVPCLPSQSPDRELNHRIEWLRRHVGIADPTVASAYDAYWALDGTGGAFHAAEDKYQGRSIELVLCDAGRKWRNWKDRVGKLRQLRSRLPGSWSPTDLLSKEVASEFSECVR